jgi:hypothetical protein
MMIMIMMMMMSPGVLERTKTPAGLPTVLTGNARFHFSGTAQAAGYEVFLIALRCLLQII